MWFKKKEELKSDIPDMPELPELPELPEPESPKLDESPEKISSKPQPISLSKSQLPALPELPNPAIDKMSQQAIKSEISREKIRPYTREMPSGNFKIQDSGRVKEYPFQARNEPMTREIGFMPAEKNQLPAPPHFIQSRARFQQPERSDKEPVFVRLDKFQNALNNFSEINSQLLEIERYLEDIKRMRAKEDQELGEWEREILEIKSKLESIDRGIFSKL